MPEPRWDVLKLMMTAPDSQLEAGMVDKLRNLQGKSSEEVKSGLHEIIDHCARYSLASDFVMRILDEEWKFLGGKVDDPAPWRESMP